MKTRHRPVITNLPKVKGTAPKIHSDDLSRVKNKKQYDKNYEFIFGGKNGKRRRKNAREMERYKKRRKKK